MARGRTKKTTFNPPAVVPQNGNSLEFATARGGAGGRKKNSKEVKKLIDLGKEKGYLTYNELNEILPPNIVSPDQIDDVMTIFGEMDIEVVDSNQRAAIRTQTDEAVEEEEDEEEDEEESDSEEDADLEELNALIEDLK